MLHKSHTWKWTLIKNNSRKLGFGQWRRDILIITLGMFAFYCKILIFNHDKVYTDELFPVIQREL